MSVNKQHQKYSEDFAISVLRSVWIATFGDFADDSQPKQLNIPTSHSLNMTFTEKSIIYTNPDITPSEVLPGNKVELPFGFGPLPANIDNKRIFFFDIDNCLYSRGTGIHELMQVKIHNYFKDLLELDDEQAHKLHLQYYLVYGLAVEGLVRKHNVDALEYNSKVDDSLDLKSVIHYNQKLREQLIRLRPHYDYFWLVTNAYKNHAMRCVSFLGIGDLFDGLTFCDYGKFPIICKPMPEYFHGFLKLTNIDSENKLAMQKQSFIDDSEINCKAAHKLGFGTVIHVIELDDDFTKVHKKDDFELFYGSGDNSDSSKIKIIRTILELESIL